MLFDGSTMLPVGAYSNVEKAKIAARTAERRLVDWSVVRFPVDHPAEPTLRIMYAVAGNQGTYM